MRRKGTTVFLAASLLFAGGALYGPAGLAHPPYDTFDDTVFAPIERTKRDISVELVAQGLVAPLKGVTAPGLPNTLFVVDQPGQIWAIDLTGPRPVDCPGPDCTLFHDVGADLVTLGCVPDVTASFGGSFDERGLLGLAFHPDFAANGRLYAYTSQPNAGAPTFPTTLPGGPGTGDHQNVLAEWQAVDAGDPGAGVNAASRRELMRVDWPQFNHDGGDLAFGADDMLYIAMGDGGGADDRDGQDFILCGSSPSVDVPIVGHGLDGNGQKLTSTLGKILRIDVDGTNAANGQYGIPGDNPFANAGGGVIGEIFALGLRNAFRMSFDRKDGDLYAGDVGQNDIEEVDVIVSGGNYGWPIREGTLFFAHNGNDAGFATPDDPGTAVAPPALAPNLSGPLAQYDTHHEGHSAIGGFVYRGSEIDELRGRYIFGDFSTIFRFPIGPQDYGRLLHLNPGGKKGLRRIQEFMIVPTNNLALSLLGWGEDAGGELYPMGNISGLPFFDEGLVLKLVPANGDDDDD